MKKMKILDRLSTPTIRKNESLLGVYGFQNVWKQREGKLTHMHLTYTKIRAMICPYDS